MSVPIPLFPKFAFVPRDILYRPFFARVTLLGYPARDSVFRQHKFHGIIVRNEGQFSSSSCREREREREKKEERFWKKCVVFLSKAESFRGEYFEDWPKTILENRTPWKRPIDPVTRN